MLVRDPAVLWRRTLDGILLLPPDSAEALVITGAGCAVWDLLVEPATAEELVRDMAEVYRRPVPDIESDVSGVLRYLAEVGALKVTGRPD